MRLEVVEKLALVCEHGRKTHESAFGNRVGLVDLVKADTTTDGVGKRGGIVIVATYMALQTRCCIERFNKNLWKEKKTLLRKIGYCIGSGKIIQRV